MRARSLVLAAPAIAILVSLATARGGDGPAAPDELPPPAGLTLDGVPRVPGSVAAAIASWSELRATHFSGWHSTKREMLVTRVVGGVAQLHSLAAPMGPLSQITHGKQSTSYALVPPRRDDYLVLVRGLPDAEMFPQLFRASAGSVKLLSDGKTSRNWAGAWSNAGDRLAYRFLPADGRTTSLAVVDPSDPKSARVVATLDGPGWYPTDWSKDDKQLLVIESVSATESYVWLLDVETGAKTALTPRDAPEKTGFGWGSFARDGKSILVASDRGAEFQRPCRLDRETGEVKPLGDAIKWQVERFALSPDRKTLAVVANEEGTGRLHVLDADTGAERPYPKLPRGHVTLVAFHQNNKDLAFELESARSPGELWSLDLESGAVEKWCASETGGIDLSQVGEPELVRWKGEGGLALSGWLTKPPARFTGKRPVLIEIHDGPELQARPTFRGRQGYLTTELGVALLEPNVRGSSGYGKSFLELDNGTRREDAIKDVGALLDWIKTRDDLDADRVMVAGTRYGGFMSLACAERYDARIRGTIDIGGWVDLVTFVEKTQESRLNLVRAEYGDEQDPKIRDFLDQISPVTNASKIKKPLFVAQGAKDARVNLDEVQQLVSAARKNGVKVWYLLGQEEQAGFARPKNVDFVFCSSVQFIREVLLGEQAEKE